MMRLKAVIEKKWEIILFLLIAILAILLRLYKLDQVPLGFTGDEAWLGLDGQEILKRGWIGIYIPGHAWGYNAFHAYLVAPLVKLLGPGVFSVRLATAIPGILGLIAFYFLSKIFFSSGISLIITGFLAISRWHIHFSRIAFPGIILVPLFSTLSVLFLQKGIIEKKYLSFALVGLFLGLGINSYHYFNFTFLAILLFLTIQLLIQKNFLRDFWKNLALMFLILLVTVLPYGFYIIKNPSIIRGKWEHVSVFVSQNMPGSYRNNVSISKLELITGQVKKTLGLFFVHGDPDALNGPPGVVILELPLAAISLLGLILLLTRLGKSKNLLVLLWFVAALTVGIFTADAPNSKRIIDAVVPTFLFLGYGFLFLKEKLPKILFYFLLVIIFAYSSAFNYQQYFIKYAQDNHVKARFAFEITQMCKFFSTFNYQPYIYFYHPNTYFNYETRRFLCPNLIGEDRSKEYGQFSIESLRKPPFSFVYFGPYKKIVSDLIKKYPEGQNQEFNEQGNFIWGFYSIEGKSNEKIKL